MTQEQVLEKLKLLANKNLKALAKESFNLRAISKAYDGLNRPGSNIAVIHVAGTNGKGSVSYKIANSLILSGYRVGLFSSPHIFTFRERITINHKPIAKEVFCKILGETFCYLEKNKESLNFFEILFLVCLQYFEGQKVDCAVIETGLGGRLDATNILSPILTLITSISYDHTNILGKTLEEIATEKAGIIKEGIPVVLGPTANLPIILKVAAAKKSQVLQVNPTFSNFDHENGLVASLALNQLKDRFLLLDNEAISKGIQAKPNCRMEIFHQKDLIKKFPESPKAIVFDVAHNQAGMAALFKALQDKFQQTHFPVILGLSKQKDIQKCLEVAVKYASNIYLAQSTHPRLEEIEVLKQSLEKLKFFNFKVFPSYKDAFLSAVKIEKEALVVCGSFFIMDTMYGQIFDDQDEDIWNLTENMI